ncbi:MAG: hypothetical protein AMJ78_08155 [Omnitrophica WOR_2 bacterium SM23_29]|nr:MAG: hypothetical protein AMJ78_08155 [Omnitrophica WOR_2 bacterium SM23_29]
MALDSILDHIIGEANKNRDGIIQEARQQADALIQEARQQARKLYQEIINAEKSLLERERQKLIVNSNLESKKKLLKTKREIIDAVFGKLKSILEKVKLKKKQIYRDKIEEVGEDIDFYLNKIQLDYETEVARILFP